MFASKHSGQCARVFEMAGRYTESRERSAEVLRSALGLMGQHDASWNPITFAVWYEYAAGINLRLSQAIEKHLRARSSLGDDEIAQLHGEYIADPDQEAMQKISNELQCVMSSVAKNASNTGARAGTFGEQIDRLMGALALGDQQELPRMLDGAASTAMAMRDSTAALVQQIDDGQREIERLRADLTRAREEALLDPLTCVLNRKGFSRQLEALVRHPSVSHCRHSLLMIDIDHFKRVNDAHGHLMGDQVIQGLAEVLRRCVPEADQRVARYGGEEFVVLLPGASLRDGVRLAEEVRQCASAMQIRDRATQRVVTNVTVSVGVAAMQFGDEPSSWIARADGALYKSKQAGRDRVTCA